MQRKIIILYLLLLAVPVCAQINDAETNPFKETESVRTDVWEQNLYGWQNGSDGTKINWGENVNYLGEIQASGSSGNTPLWLNANKHGLSSLESWNGYVRGGIIRPIATDDNHRWGIGYGVDLAVGYNYTSKLIVQQAFIEGRWLHGQLTIGQKDYPMEMKNQKLSSGSQTLGINARSVPQVRLALPRYWAIPGLGKWVHLKGHIAYGMLTDDSWQHSFTNRETRYADHTLYHSKAGYLKIGKEFFPVSLEMGIEMACLFGGTPHYIEDGVDKVYTTEKGLKGFWHAFIPGGSDTRDGEYANAAGNQLGSYVLRLNYDVDSWALSLYADHFFEDHSQMFFLDYNGYGKGEEYQVKKERKYFVYKLKDMMLGAELKLKYSRWIDDIVFEYIYTKYQSGPINHDRTKNISDHYAGKDDYYNHSVYAGWQHWGQVIGNPLYRSPLYNTDGNILIKDNRFMAFHLGIGGNPGKNLNYRVLATWQEGLGRYDDPYVEKQHNISVMAEATYHFPYGIHLKAAFGMDHGKILGNNYGGQLTISKTGIFGKR